MRMPDGEFEVISLFTGKDMFGRSWRCVTEPRLQFRDTFYPSGEFSRVWSVDGKDVASREEAEERLKLAPASDADPIEPVAEPPPLAEAEAPGARDTPGPTVQDRLRVLRLARERRALPGAAPSVLRESLSAFADAHTPSSGMDSGSDTFRDPPWSDPGFPKAYDAFLDEVQTRSGTIVAARLAGACLDAAARSPLDAMTSEGPAMCGASLFLMPIAATLLYIRDLLATPAWLRAMSSILDSLSVASPAVHVVLPVGMTSNGLDRLRPHMVRAALDAARPLLLAAPLQAQISAAAAAVHRLLGAEADGAVAEQHRRMPFEWGGNLPMGVRAIVGVRLCATLAPDGFVVPRLEAGELQAGTGSVGDAWRKQDAEGRVGSGEIDLIDPPFALSTGAAVLAARLILLQIRRIAVGSARRKLVLTVRVDGRTCAVTVTRPERARYSDGTYGPFPLPASLALGDWETFAATLRQEVGDVILDVGKWGGEAPYGSVPFK